MSEFERILNNLPKSFEEFYQQVMLLMEFGDLSEDENAVIKEEVEKLYSEALIEASTKVLEPDDLDFIEGYLLLNPLTTRIDVFFAAASEKPNIDQVLKQVLQEVMERLEYLKSKITDAK